MNSDRFRRLPLLLVLTAPLTLPAISSPAVGGEIGFLEQFALAEDRSVALAELIPGTEDFYYYHCLHYQHLQQFNRVDELLRMWVERFKDSPRIREIQARQALLVYNRDPQRTLAFLRGRLGLRFDHQREAVDRASQLPAQLDAALISRERLLKIALERHGNLNGFEDRALFWLAAGELTPDQRRDLLQRLARPDVEGIVPLVLADLRGDNRIPFGTHPIHGQLLRRQLDELVRQDSSLLNQTAFVNIYLSKLIPSPDEDWQNDLDAREAYLDELWAFVARLSEAHNSLKAHVLYHRLALDVQRERFDKTRLLTYLKLPRPASYMNPRFLGEPQHRRFPANLEEDFQSQTGFPPVRNDESVVRIYLEHFFVEADSYREFEPYVRDNYLRELFAETKVVHQLGDPEQWASLLSSDAYQRLRDRVDLEFAPSNSRVFDADEEITLDLYVKNVPTLITKVYHINALNYYQDLAQHVTTAINLDGLIANREVTTELQESPFHRVRRRLTFPELSEPGVYVIDFIGNGKSSRALIHKGQLRHVKRPTAAGYAFTVLDQEGNSLSDARIWMAGRTYTPESNGEILIPYSTQPQQQPIILLHGQLASLDRFFHGSETYTLQAGIHVDRESLRSRREIPLLIRPALLLSGTPISVGALEEPRLEITAVDLDGVHTTSTVSDLDLRDDRDTVHSLRVPPRLSQLTIALKGRVKSLSENKTVDVEASASFQVNGIEQTDAIDQLELVPNQDGYWIEVLGKTGEPKANRPVNIELKHRDFRDTVNVVLRSNEAGRVHLGPLDGIESVSARIGEHTSIWNLDTNLTDYDQTIHTVVGEPIEIPIAAGGDGAPGRADFSLLEIRGDTFVADHFERLAIRRGALVIEDLEAGDYNLWLAKPQKNIQLRVTPGPVRAGHAISPTRTLELGNHAPPRIVAVQIQQGKAMIELEHITPATRVHLLASYFHPAFDPFRQLAHIANEQLLRWQTFTLPSFYVQGRTIGDELRYILERRYATKYPGNMLDRPELLLHPWDVRDTQTSREQLVEGDEFAQEAPAAAPMAGEPTAGARTIEVLSEFETVDYLAADPLIQLNLKPNAEGRIEVDLEDMAGRSVIYVLLVDPQSVDQRTAYLPTAERVHEDLRLATGLDPKSHFALTKQTSLFEAGQTITLGNLGSGRFQLYDSLPRVYQLYETLLPGSHLAEFRFILSWSQLSDERQRELYSKYACHELNFFLLQKDPEFFQAVVLPYLQHKLHKTFLDDYLLGNELRSYLSPWKYEQLNAVERILLARRIEGEVPYTQDYLESKWAVVPTDQDRLNFLFDTALLGQALEQQIAAVDELSDRDRTFFRRSLAGGLAGVEGAPALGTPVQAEAMGLKAGRAATAFDAASSNGAVLAEQEARLARDLSLRGEAMLRRLYQPLDKTKEWAENNYYRLPIDQQNADLVTVNDLWLNWIRHGEQPGFRSIHFAQVRNFTEAMFALAVLDLPDSSPEHATQVVDQALRLQTSGPVIVLHEQLEPATTGEQAPPVLVSQNFFRLDDRYSMVNGVRVDRFVSGEFLYQMVYGCQLVVTNPTSSQQTLDVLTQLPTGALPVHGAKMTQTFRLQLGPYQTQPIEYRFYFPAPGDFVQFPAHVTKDRQLVAAAEPATFHVVRELSEIDREAWDFVSQHGSDQDVLDFLKERNLQALNLDRIAFRMGDIEFFQQAVATLRSRHVYNHTLWSYAVHHNDRGAMSEFLDHADPLIAECGELLVGPLVAIDPIARKTYEHLEYHPLVNARAHQISHPREILNDRFHWQYHRWLKLVGYMRQMDDQSRLVTVYYLLLQDRLGEAIEHFKLIDPYHITTRLQYDYCQAYLSMTQGDLAKARSVAMAYENYPVDRWRHVFAVVRNHLDEIEGQSTPAVDPMHRNQSQDQLASDAPAFEFRVENKQLRLQYRNVDRLTVRYYLMDIELLFSHHPFVERHVGQFSYIAPNLTETIELSESAGQLDKPLPPELLHQNVLIEIEGAGQRESQPYYSNALTVQTIENYGQLRVTHQETKKPLPTVYCKVYALQQDGSTVFYKDGYTDLRGRFDYATLSTDQLDHVQRFAILILSEDAGATVREVEPPKR